MPASRVGAGKVVWQEIQPAQHKGRPGRSPGPVCWGHSVKARRGEETLFFLSCAFVAWSHGTFLLFPSVAHEVLDSGLLALGQQALSFPCPTYVGRP